ncbi:MAG: hypothetical protein RLZZ157_3 [Pseudomonadota bacterium]
MFGGMSVSDAQKLRALEVENGRPKFLLADAIPDNSGHHQPPKFARERRSIDRILPIHAVRHHQHQG